MFSKETTGNILRVFEFFSKLFTGAVWSSELSCWFYCGETDEIFD